MKANQCQNRFYWSVLCQHLGVAPEKGVYSRDKMSDPAYKPPPTLSRALRLQNGDITVLLYRLIAMNQDDIKVVI